MVWPEAQVTRLVRPAWASGDAARAIETRVDRRVKTIFYPRDLKARSDWAEDYLAALWMWLKYVWATEELCTGFIPLNRVVPFANQPIPRYWNVRYTDFFLWESNEIKRYALRFRQHDSKTYRNTRHTSVLSYGCQRLPLYEKAVLCRAYLWISSNSYYCVRLYSDFLNGGPKVDVSILASVLISTYAKRQAPS